MVSLFLWLPVIVWHHGFSICLSSTDGCKCSWWQTANKIHFQTRYIRAKDIWHWVCTKKGLISWLVSMEVRGSELGCLPSESVLGIYRQREGVACLFIGWQEGQFPKTFLDIHGSSHLFIGHTCFFGVDCILGWGFRVWNFTSNVRDWWLASTHFYSWKVNLKLSLSEFQRLMLWNNKQLLEQFPSMYAQVLTGLRSSRYGGMWLHEEEMWQLQECLEGWALVLAAAALWGDTSLAQEKLECYYMKGCPDITLTLWSIL